MDTSDLDSMTLIFDKETAEAIRQMAKLTHAPNEQELVRDALNTFRWILQRQMDGYKIVAYKGSYDNPEDPALLADLRGERKKAA